MLTHTYPHKSPGKTKVAIYNHQVDSWFHSWPCVFPGNLQAKKRAWSYMTPNVHTETKCGTANCTFLLPSGRIQLTHHTSMLVAWVTQTQFSSTRYSSLLGRQRKYGQKVCPKFYHDQHWESDPRPFDLESNALSTRPHTPIKPGTDEASKTDRSNFQVWNLHSYSTDHWKSLVMKLTPQCSAPTERMPSCVFMVCSGRYTM